MSNKAVSATYRTIIDDVVANVRQDFEDMGIEREILEELQRSWEAKIIATCVAEFDGAGETSGAAAAAGKGARKAKEKEVKPNAKHEAEKAEKAALALNGGAEAGPSGSNGNGNGSVAGSSSQGAAAAAAEASRKAVRTESGARVATTSLFTSASEAPPTAQETRAGEKRKRAQATDEITSDLDDSDEEADEPGEVEGEDMVLCLYDKVQRVKNKWKCVLKDGVASIDGRDYVFSKLTSDFEW